jgi:translation initiation factor eIF-2B subunit gamma
MALFTQLHLHRLYPISEEDNLPKALLPVGNKPVISYTLEWLEKAGIHGN